jgi:hypothetical protein
MVSFVERMLKLHKDLPKARIAPDKTEGKHASHRVARVETVAKTMYHRQYDG